MRRRINQKAKRTPTQWCRHFNTYIMDPDGWRRDKKPFEARITQYEFLARWLYSTAKQSVKVRKAFDRLAGDEVAYSLIRSLRY